MSDRAENTLLVLPGLLLLALAFFVPITQMLVLSVSGENGPTLDHFTRFLGDPYYLNVLWRTVRLSLIITVICAAVGFPLAYIMARVGPRLRLWLIVLVILPLMTSVVVRTFGWMVLLSRSGLVPQVLRDLGLAERNFSIMQTELAIVIGMVQVLLPFMTLSILGVVTRIDRRLEEAARTMGCTFMQTLRTVVFPLAVPGIVAGSLLVFTLSASSFVTPNLLGGSRIQVLAASIYRSVTQTLDWPFAAAQAVILFAGILLILVPYARLAGGRSNG
ncbi:ABC transporter permease [Stappia taiwanensis]|uniref:ABC transporter permease n=1 Tax=Stappia taiwanensis TaxID=992267 RepID=A0A838XWH7_9HYPH|nr:ABC transporter permease [Stappia taiwanensis]MBA4613371.1 ABC transporter permease [Stappia taiwanensis]GGE82018.1 ABC transporter permease [Stappia taiwanensis]